MELSQSQWLRYHIKIILLNGIHYTNKFNDNQVSYSEITYGDNVKPFTKSQYQMKNESCGLRLYYHI